MPGEEGEGGGGGGSAAADGITGDVGVCERVCVRETEHIAVVD